MRDCCCTYALRCCFFPYIDDHSDDSDNTGDALKGVTAFYRIHTFSSCLCTRDVTVCRHSLCPVVHGGFGRSVEGVRSIQCPPRGIAYHPMQSTNGDSSSRGHARRLGSVGVLHSHLLMDSCSCIDSCSRIPCLLCGKLPEV